MGVERAFSLPLTAFSVALAAMLLLSACVAAPADPQRPRSAATTPISSAVISGAASASTSPSSPSPAVSITPALATLPPTPKPTRSAELSLSPSVAASLDPATAEAVRIRKSFDLRADLEWIAAVAKRTDTSADYGTPFTPDEVAELNLRWAEADAILPSVQDYAAAHAGEFGGLYIDQANGAHIVTLWAGHLAEHDADVRALIAPRENVDVRLVRYTEAELRDLQATATGAMDWMRAIGALLMTSSVDVIANHAIVTISSANPDAPRLIREHLAANADMLVVESDGTGLELLPRGTIKGRVLDAAGRPVKGVAINPRSRVSAWCGDEVGHETDADGRFVLEHCAPTNWTIEVFRAYPAILGTATVEVRPGKTVNVVIHVTR